MAESRLHLVFAFSPLSKGADSLFSCFKVAFTVHYGVKLPMLYFCLFIPYA